MGRLDRRDLLVRGAAGLGGLGLLGPRALLARRASSEGDPGRVLVLLQLSGGNDGLSLLVPWSDDAYHRARSATRVHADEVLRLDERRGLHPELARLRARHDAGQVALVEGVGYPEPNRSHFESLEIWHAADARGRGVTEGWVGRLLGAAFGDEAHPLRVVHVGGTSPYALHSSTHPPLAMAVPRTYRWVGNEDDVEELRVAPEDGDGPLARLRRAMDDAARSSEAVRAAVRRHRPAVEYPSGRFAERLRVAAALIHAELGTRVVSLELDGFDTHNDQRRRHDALMRTLDPALDAFLGDLAASEPGRRAVVLAFSEFGRRLAENDSRGTDHGAAGVALALGHQVEGGLYGAPSSLTELDDGDPAFTTDFRALYATAAHACFGVEPTAFLGEDFEPLGW